MTHPRLQTALERRPLEMFFAAATLIFGIFLALPMDSMDSPAYTVLIQAAPEPLWAWLFLTNGLSHGLWLAVNGSRWWSPFMRFAAALFSMLIYAFWSVGFALHDPTTTGIVTYGIMSAGSLWCCVLAWRDALVSVRLANAYRTA